jgi:sigma-B regulation protein RsbU (phosphoserine phosphatase)
MIEKQPEQGDTMIDDLETIPSGPIAEGGADPEPHMVPDPATEVATLRARLRASEEALAEYKRREFQCQAACDGEDEQMRRARRSLELAGMIVENSPAVLFRRRAGLEPGLLYVSENIRQWGYSSTDFLSGRVNFKDILHPDDLDRLGAEIRRIYDTKLVDYAQEYRILTASGEVRWVSDETAVIRDEAGVPLYNQGVLMDITARKRAEMALARSEFKFRRIIEGAAEGYLLLDRNQTVSEVNDAFCRMLGYGRDDILGRRYVDFATLEHRRYLEANRERLRRHRHRRMEGGLIHRDGRVVSVLINAGVLSDETGDFVGTACFVADLTEQRKAIMLAGEVQKSLLPSRAPVIAGLDVAGASVASEETGGDYFDYLEADDAAAPTLSVAVGDISGHGVDAALLMSTARGILRMRAAQPGGPGQIITEMNRQLAADLYGSGRFMTLFYLRIDPLAGTVRWVRAGHDPALIYCPVADTFTMLGGRTAEGGYRDDGGLPLGVLRESVYQEQEADLAPGQIIAVGTDGIWEARDPSGRMFGKERFREIVRGNAFSGAQEILAAVMSAVRAFTHGAKAEDDITLVIIKYGFSDE